MVVFFRPMPFFRRFGPNQQGSSPRGKKRNPEKPGSQKSKFKGQKFPQASRAMRIRYGARGDVASLPPDAFFADATSWISRKGYFALFLKARP